MSRSGAATISAGGSFTVFVSQAEQKLTGEYNFGKLTVDAVVEINLGWLELEEKRSLTVWDGIKGKATVDLSDHFN
ncbi:MAG: hypothetical protein DDT33_00161 [Firmicutes bacterium]|nr:hypothetical protein [Bacillota bacterium]